MIAVDLSRRKRIRQLPKEKKLNFSQVSVTILSKIANYQEARVILTNTQLNKLKCVARNDTVTILRINDKNFEDQELPHQLLWTTR